MGMNSPAEIAQNYCATGKAKAERPFARMLVLAIMAGAIIALGGVASNTVSHGMESVAASRAMAGVFFAFGLPMVMLSGAELFTGNSLICITCLNKETTITKMLRNWVVVYFGNFIGGVLVAAGCAYAGQFNYSAGGLAVQTIRIAVAKCSLSFGPALVMGIFCNILVCMGVVCSLAAKDATGRILGAFVPVAAFVASGYEHCVANMYYVPAGIFAMMRGDYAALAAEAGIDTAALTWGNFFVKNLIPVTLGNIIGGMALGFVLWGCFLKQPAKKS
ncbi:formate/nitrite transporter family protein [Clostridia bacterium OttesenSCG-928-O13]|nr:formate/nitrite transporter family protein [Clostridia bacterium OttesenSCG-928-O13]